MKYLHLAMMVVGALYFYQVARGYTPTGMKYDHLAITYSCGSPELQQAVQQWAAVSALTDGGCSGTPDIEATVVDPWPYPRNILGLAGITKTNFPGHTAIVCSIQIQPTVEHYLGVWIHEVGHCLWSAHSTDPNSTMAPYCCNPLNSDDIAGVIAIYGPPETGAIIPRAYLPGVAK